MFRIEGGVQFDTSQKLLNGSNTDRVFKNWLASLTRIPSSKYMLPAKKRKFLFPPLTFRFCVNFGEGKIHHIQMILDALNCPKTSCVFRTARAPEAQQKKRSGSQRFFPAGGQPNNPPPRPNQCWRGEPISVDQTQTSMILEVWGTASLFRCLLRDNDD